MTSRAGMDMCGEITTDHGPWALSVNFSKQLPCVVGHHGLHFLEEGAEAQRDPISCHGSHSETQMGM